MQPLGKQVVVVLDQAHPAIVAAHVVVGVKKKPDVQMTHKLEALALVTAADERAPPKLVWQDAQPVLSEAQVPTWATAE